MLMTLPGIARQRCSPTGLHPNFTVFLFEI
jgi:hypothetical protein